ncbi:MAG: hypothetical protein AAFR53_05795 [Pseudomonadota bacterium]
MRLILLLSVLLVTACAQLPPVEPDAPTVAEPDTPTEEPSTDEQPDAPAPEPTNETLATLGNAAEPGLWLKTPLVSVEGPGRITVVASGRSLDVTLIPIDGPPTAGSRASLAALQGLGVPLTAITELRVTPL